MSNYPVKIPNFLNYKLPKLGKLPQAKNHWCRSCGKIGHLINECPDIGYFKKYCPNQKVKPIEIFSEFEELSCSNSTMPVFHSMSYIKQLME